MYTRVDDWDYIYGQYIDVGMTIYEKRELRELSYMMGDHE